MVALLSWDGSLIRGKLSHIQHSEHPTMVSIRRIVTQWGRRIVGGLIVTLLFSQMALAMYACPKLDADTHAASMQMAGMAMDEAAGMSAMPDCHAMPGTMDDESPQLCRAHCSGDGKPALLHRRQPRETGDRLACRDIAIEHRHGSRPFGDQRVGDG